MIKASDWLTASEANQEDSVAEAGTSIVNQQKEGQKTTEDDNTSSSSSSCDSDSDTTDTDSDYDNDYNFKRASQASTVVPLKNQPNTKNFYILNPKNQALIPMGPLNPELRPPSYAPRVAPLSSYAPLMTSFFEI